ncbi:hypothetical protein [Phenylobacterium sp.]|uniref:hypothetical protein n=1 Tax=Phenylobacterium sp. TaxID=1871053 RepID=UPI002C3E8100|nr:hypothetical protein [Phenylobacterium sp.]HVI32150.1 hypothetical protein [Phenylobacterium sp.]
MGEKDIWFRYEVTAGRFSGTPVNWKGWLALAGLIGAPTGLLLLAMPWLRPLGPLGVILGLAVVFAIVFPGAVALVRAKGRRVN